MGDTRREPGDRKQGMGGERQGAGDRRWETGDLNIFTDNYIYIQIHKCICIMKKYLLTNI